MPVWLDVLAIASLSLAALSVLIVLFDIFIAGNRQHMWIMDAVWPLTALWAGPAALWAYFRFGRLSTHRAMAEARQRDETPPAKKKPWWQTVSVAVTHCGSGCTLGDVIAEWFAYFVPITLFGMTLFGTWALDFALAFAFGIAFQYFTIKPMQQLGPWQGLVAAVKADTLSLTAWQVGMYGWMAVATFLIFGHELPKTQPVFWFMMQIAMFAGFLTSFPVNVWLLRRGIKEPM